MHSFQPLPIADIEQLEGIRVQMNDQVTCLVTLYIPSLLQKVSIEISDIPIVSFQIDSDQISLYQEMSFTMEDRDAEEFVLVLSGYYRLLTEREVYMDLEKDLWSQDSAPTYHARHTVCPAPWSYARDEAQASEHEKYVDFTATPKFTCYPDNTTVRSEVLRPI